MAQYIPDLFVGREDEIEDFLSWLNDPNAAPVRFYSAGGGMGKTWLLKALKQATHKLKDPKILVAPYDSTPTDFESIGVFDLITAAYHSIENVRESIVASLGEKLFLNCRKAQQSYITATDQTESIQEALYTGVDKAFRKDLVNICSSYNVILFFDTFERVYWEEVGYWLTYKLPLSVPNLKIVIAGRPPSEGPREFGEQIEFIKLSVFQNIEAIFRFFQTRGTISSKNVTAENKNLVNMIANKFTGVPLRLELAALLFDQTCMALLPLEQEKEDLFEPLSTEAANEKLKEFLDAMNPEEVERQLIKFLHRMLASEVTAQEASFEVNGLPYNVYDIILKMSYLNRRFTSRFVAPIYGVQPEAAVHIIDGFFENFPYHQTYFVKRTGDRVQLHDEMERLILKYGWDLQYTDKISIKEEQDDLARDALVVYDDLIKNATPSEFKRASLEAERLDYQLRLDTQKGYEEFCRLFDENMDHLRIGSCEMFAAEIRPYVSEELQFHAQDETDFDPEVKFNIESRLATLSFRLGHLEASQEGWRRALTLAPTPELKVDALIGLHNSTWRLDVNQAAKYLKQGLRICEHAELPVERLGRIQQLLGFTYRQAGDVEKAIKWYDNCIQTAKRLIKKNDTDENMREAATRLYTEAKNSRGFCHALQGQLKEAESEVWEALRIRQAHGQAAEVGRSYSTRGEIARLQGDFRIANAFYNEAVKIFKEINDQEWLALVLQERGENARQLANKYRKHGEYDRAADWVSLAYDGLEESYAKYQYYNLTRERTRMLRHFGRVLRDSNQLEQAMKRLHEALDLAKKNENVLEQLKVLLSLARVAARSGDEIEMQRYLGRVQSMAIDFYLVDTFEGLTHLARGEYHYTQNQWENAFSEIVDGLVKLGHAGGEARSYFFSYHDQLQIYLNGLPEVKMKENWCDELIKIWKNEGLDKELPEIIHLCENYRDSLVFL